MTSLSFFYGYLINRQSLYTVKAIVLDNFKAAMDFLPLKIYRDLLFAHRLCLCFSEWDERSKISVDTIFEGV